MLLVKIAAYEGCCDARHRLTLDRRRRRSLGNQLLDRPRRVARRRRLEFEKISIFIEHSKFFRHAIACEGLPHRRPRSSCGADRETRRCRRCFGRLFRAGMSSRSSEAADCLSVELEELVDVFAAIEVRPPCRLLFAAVIGHEVAEQVFRSQRRAASCGTPRRSAAAGRRPAAPARGRCGVPLRADFLAMPDAFGARRLKLGMTGRIGRLDYAKR